MEKVNSYIKPLAISFVVFTLTGPLLAQDQIPDFVTIVERSKNPEQIPQETVYSSLANFLISTSPPRCSSSNGDEPNVSSVAHCAAPLPGIDMSKAVQLANEYETRKRLSNDLFPENFCGDTSFEFSRKSTADFAADLESAIDAISADNAAYFEQRAQKLLGDEGYEALMKYAENSIRPNTTFSLIDQRLMMEEAGITPAIMVDRICKGQSRQ